MASMDSPTVTAPPLYKPDVTYRITQRAHRHYYLPAIFEGRLVGMCQSILSDGAVCGVTISCAEIERRINERA